MKHGRSLFTAAVLLAFAGMALVTSSCGAKEDEDPPPTSTRYTCDGTLAQCLKIMSGWTLDVKTTDEIIFDPSVVELPDGSFRIYGNASGFPGRVISLISTDGGVTFTLEPGDRIVADAGHDAFFPNVIALPNGDFRMYLTDQRTHIGSEGAPAFISAISDDGLNFTWETGERLHYSGTGDEAGGIRNQNVVLLGDGTFRMYYAAGVKVLSAVSADGLTFTREDGVRYNLATLCPPNNRWVNPKVYLDDAGTFHMFTGGAACDDMNHTNEKFGVFWGTSPDGLAFTFSSVAVVQGYYIKSLYQGNPGDPSVVAEDPMLVLTPAGLRLYFNCGSTAGTPPFRYYSVYNPDLH